MNVETITTPWLFITGGLITAFVIGVMLLIGRHERQYELEKAHSAAWSKWVTDFLPHLHRFAQNLTDPHEVSQMPFRHMRIYTDQLESEGYIFLVDDEQTFLLEDRMAHEVMHTLRELHLTNY